VARSEGVRTLALNRDGVSTKGAPISQSTLWLRSTWAFDGKSQFAYSLDGTNFKIFGESYQLTWGSYRGDRVGIFTFNTAGEMGYLDIDDFQYTVQR
jgi:hypothetical protein